LGQAVKASSSTATQIVREILSEITVWLQFFHNLNQKLKLRRLNPKSLFGDLTDLKQNLSSLSPTAPVLDLLPCLPWETKKRRDRDGL